MKTYKYAITFDVIKEFKVKASSPEEANHIMHKRVEKMTKNLFKNSNIGLDNPNGHIIPDECREDFPYEY